MYLKLLQLLAVLPVDVTILLATDDNYFDSCGQ